MLPWFESMVPYLEGSTRTWNMQRAFQELLSSSSLQLEKGLPGSNVKAAGAHGRLQLQGSKPSSPIGEAMDARVGDKSLLIIYLAVQLTDAGTVTENVQWHIVNKVSTGRYCGDHRKGRAWKQIYRFLSQLLRLHTPHAPSIPTHTSRYVYMDLS